MTPQQAADLFRSDDLIGIGMEADKVRQKLHPEGVVNYVIQGELDLACIDNTVAACEQLDSLAGLGARSIVLTGGLPPDASIRKCVELVRALKQRLDISISGLSSRQLAELAKAARAPLSGAIAQLWEGGLDSIGSNAMPDAAGGNRALWCEAHRAAHKVGMHTTARIAFASGGTVPERVDALETIARLQDEGGGFVSLAPTFTGSAEEPTAVEYLKTLAASRLYLLSISNCEDSWKGAGMKVCQVGLRFGGNDLGCAEVYGSNPGDPQRQPQITAGELRRLIRDAGFLPKQRNELYTVCFLD